MGARRLREFVFVLLATPACSENVTAKAPPPHLPSDGRKAAAHATEVSCGSMPEASGEGCAIEAGTGGELFLRGVVLTEAEIIRGGGVLVDAAGTIACVGCDCAERAASATTVTCPNSVISPGLVNAHDHLSYAHHWPHPDDGERFEHRHDWRRGLHGHSNIEPPDGATTDQLQWGELRFVLGGATSTLGGRGTPGFLRNLDYAPNSEGLGERSIRASTFPLGDGEYGNQLDTGCAYPAVPSREELTGARSYVMHVAEGVDAFARNEFECLSGEGGADLMAPEVSIVHGLALGAPDFARMAAAGARLVWSPRSNVALYGDTARVTIAATLGVSIALGTDWIYTGSTNVPRELACADSLNSAKFGHFFSDFELWSMVTTNAAKSAGALDVIGTLAPGRRADIAIFDASVSDAHRAVIEAAPSDVQLVLRDGKPLYGDAVLVGALFAGACSDLDVCGSTKQVCTGPSGGSTFDDLAAANADLYPSFYCGVPEGEPTCAPQRSASIAGSSTYDGAPTDADADGDGIDDEDDACPAVFDPIRPVDDGAQPDTDGDGAGDACDSTPS